MSVNELRAENVRVMSCVLKEILSMQDKCSGIQREAVRGITITLFDARKKCGLYNAGIMTFDWSNFNDLLKIIQADMLELGGWPTSVRMVQKRNEL